MNYRTRSFHFFIIILLFFFINGSKKVDISFDPAAIFLTWQYDPSTSMTIDWHVIGQKNTHLAVIQLRKSGADNWRELPANSSQFPFSDRVINRVELRGLESATFYEFRFGENSEIYRFRTLPSDLSEQTVRFVTGGDTSDRIHTMTARAMDYDPDFILWGGDLAYANGDPERIDMWYGWFDGIKENLIDENGRVVPVVVAIGNHELFGERRLRRQDLSDEEIQDYLDRYNLWDDKPTFFFDLFAFPGRPSYNILDAGDYISIVAASW